jgi:hypothetical protein
MISSMQPPDGTGGPTPDTLAWSPGAEVEGRSTEIFLHDMKALNLGSLSDWLARSLESRGIISGDDLELYADALFDLSRLAEEFRYLRRSATMQLGGPRRSLAGTAVAIGALTCGGPG